jgi:iron complex outermembrane receptor protein
MVSRSRHGLRSYMLFGTTALTLGAMPALNPAQAQTTPPGPAQAAAATPAGKVGLEEIVVTARKRKESLIRVPVSETALSSRDLQRYPTNNLQQIGQLAPQVIIAKTGGGGAGASLSIRGVGSSALDAGIDQSVAVVIDGLQITRGRIITQGLFDLSQVEILEGPQALFFGKNSPAGVIALTSQPPTATWQGYVRYGHEFNANENYVEGAYGGPINDVLSIRAAVRGDIEDGYIKNVAGPLAVGGDSVIRPGAEGNKEEPGIEETLGRLTVDYHPSEDFSAVLHVFGSAYRDNGETAGTEIKCNGGHPNTLDLTTGQVITDPYGDCKLNGRTALTALPAVRAAEYPGAGNGVPYTNYGSILTSLNMNWNLDWIKLTSVTGFVDYRNAGFDNFDYTSAGLVWGYNLDQDATFSQEIRAVTAFSGPLNFAFGLYVDDADRKTLGNGQLTPLGTDPRNGLYNNWTAVTQNHSNTYSGFAQATYAIRPNVELAVGARYSVDDKTFSGGDTYVQKQFAPFGIILPEGDILHGSYNDNNISPEATLSWHPEQNTTLYAAFKTAYKPGGFSNPSDFSIGNTAANLKFGAERAVGGEIGAKGLFLDNRLRLTATLYYYQFSGLQLTSFNAQQVAFYIQNAAKSLTEGGEFNAAYAVNNQLQLRAAASLNDAHYVSFKTAPCYSFEVNNAAGGCTTQDLSGRPLVRAPKFTSTAGISYDLPIGSGLALGLSTDVRYTTGYWMQENENPIGYQGAFFLLDAGIRLHPEDSNRWELALLGQNLTNKYYGVASNDKPLAVSTPGHPDDQIEVSIGRPMEVTLQGTYRF